MKVFRLTAIGVVLCTVAAGLMTATTASSAPKPSPRFQHLNPGGQPRLTEKVPVNVVFIGYQPGAVNQNAFRNALPRTYEPVVISRLAYEIKEPIGIKYTYDYKVKTADRAYENRFFKQLAKLSTAAPLTSFQTDYNAQAGNVRDVKNNHYIDAPSVEKWLAANPPSGIDTRRNTVFLINWSGRADFEFHVYTKTNEPDPDTGYNFGTVRDSRKITAWGGTTANDEESGLGSTRRVWFHDLSAGPDASSGSWNITDADLDGDGEPDYRIPPAWEYAAGGYRAPSALTGDLAKLVRYVAVELLFTSSPIYPAELPTSSPARTINLDSNTYEGWPGVDANRQYIKPPLVKAELAEVVPGNQLSYDDQDLPYNAEARACYEGLLADVSCYPSSGYPAFANLYLYNRENLARTQDDQGKVDYELPIFNYSVGPGVDVPALGFADDNYVDGTQSYVFNFISPDVVASGYGLTTTIIHEVGHHLGLSHPHDGYDGSTGTAFSPSGDTFFVWLGDYSNTMMSYIDLNWDFSQFDRDNLNRFQAAALNEAANALAAKVLASSKAIRGYDDLYRADAFLAVADSALKRHDYPTARAYAAKAYAAVAAGARDTGVDVQAFENEKNATARAAQAASPAHQEGLYIDTLEGPRGLR
ncbi:MAG TPA: hypothetical protein VFG33_09640 [Kribbella sp.]|uniref:hypothetical protein n=1 Tax=Kribbella sp. TaxID=1871183 RepID=UPI002D78491F|nr:hypothetical protein [Kribbella sp.]HET6293628.1 hypothetical protein [Kribbella sp.]